ncbi:MAG: caspase family protein [Chloroflexota bacterium]
MKHYAKFKVLLIGVDHCSHLPKLSPLNAQASIQDLEHFFKSCGYMVFSSLYKSEKYQEFSKPEVSEALQKLQGLPADSTVIIYFCGHGYPLPENFPQHVYLCLQNTSDESEEKLKETAIQDIWFGQQVTAVATRVERCLVIIDACYSGHIADTIIKTAEASNISNIIVIASSQSDEESFVTQEHGIPVFSKYLIAGLKDRSSGSEWIHSRDLFEYIKKGLSMENNKSNPIMLSQNNQDFPIVPVPRNKLEWFPFYDNCQIGNALIVDTNPTDTDKLEPVSDEIELLTRYGYHVTYITNTDPHILWKDLILFLEEAAKETRQYKTSFVFFKGGNIVGFTWVRPEDIGGHDKPIIFAYDDDDHDANTKCVKELLDHLRNKYSNTTIMQNPNSRDQFLQNLLNQDIRSVDKGKMQLRAKFEGSESYMLCLPLIEGLLELFEHTEYDIEDIKQILKYDRRFEDGNIRLRRWWWFVETLNESNKSDVPQRAKTLSEFEQALENDKDRLDVLFGNISNWTETANHRKLRAHCRLMKAIVKTKETLDNQVIIGFSERVRELRESLDIANEVPDFKNHLERCVGRNNLREVLSNIMQIVKKQNLSLNGDELLKTYNLLLDFSKYYIKNPQSKDKDKDKEWLEGQQWLASKLDKAEQENKNLRGEIEQNNSRVKELELQVQRTGTLVSQSCALMQQLTAATERIADLEQQLRDSKNKVNDYDTQLEQSRQQAEAAKQQIAELTAQLTASRQQTKDEVQQLTAATKCIADLEQQLAESQEQITAHEATIEHLKRFSLASFWRRPLFGFIFFCVCVGIAVFLHMYL